MLSWGAKGHEFKSRPSDHFQNLVSANKIKGAAHFCLVQFWLEKTVLNTLNQIGSEHKNLHKQLDYKGV